MNFAGNLLLEETVLAPSSEWAVGDSGWCFVRIAKGRGYWIGLPKPLELDAGEIVVLPPQAQGFLRASVLGEVVLQHFYFSPEFLLGLLTLVEHHGLQKLATSPQLEIRHWPATHPHAQKFEALWSAKRHASTLVQRCRVLELAGEILGEEISRHPGNPSRLTTAHDRFLLLIGRLTESELVTLTPDELARQCGCSVRHFSRLFRHQIGISLKAKQTELRLQKACHLLCDPEAKIVNVAMDSGYHHLGLFNVMFKQRFGVTPSQWRQQTLKKTQVKRPRRNVLRGLIFAVCLGITAQAQKALGATDLSPLAPPVTNSMPRDTNTTNALPAPGLANTGPGASKSPAFEVRGYEITGNTLMPYREMEKIFEKYVGPATTLDTIRKALSELQMAYRERGYVTVKVVLPEQTLTNGLVKVTVLQGRLTTIEVVNNRHFSSNNVMKVLPSLRTNIFLNSLVFQQDLDRANGNRDRQIYPIIDQGIEPNTSKLTLKVKDRLPLHARVELNNYAIPNSPELRLNAAVQYNNLWQLDHQVGFQYGFTPEAMKSDISQPAFYDRPLIANYSAFYRVPLNLVPTTQQRRETRFGDFGYDEATKRFRPPPPLGGKAELLFYASRSDADTGLSLQSDNLTPPTVPPAGAIQISDKLYSQSLTVNENLGARFQKPLSTFWDINASYSVGLDFKSYRSRTIQSRVFQATEFVPEFGSNGPPFVEFSSPPTSQSREVGNALQYLPFAINGEASKLDKWGSTSFTWNNGFNVSGVLGGQRDFQRVAGSLKSTGTYYVGHWGLTRDQKLYGQWSVLLRAEGQWATEPLISNEQFGVGGNAGPRGYREGQEYGDTGWRVSLEPHSSFYNAGLIGKTPLYVRFSIFSDYAQTYLLDPLPGRAQSLSLWGVGFGITAAIGQTVDLRLTLGVPLRDVPGVQAGHPYITFLMGAQF